MTYTLINAMFLVALVYLIVSGIALRQRLHAVERRLQQVTKQLPEAPIESPIEDELLLLLKQHQDVQAVKRVREVMGLSLIDAKRYIDTLKTRL